MINPKLLFNRIVLLALGLLWLPLTGHAADLDINALMSLLAQTRSAHASFVETKSIAMLDKPVVSSGELFYTAPDYLEKRSLKPKAETMVLDHGSIRITRGNKNYRLQLADYPALAAFIDSIRGTLAGDRSGLERNYTLTLEGTPARWTLQLTPTSEQLQAVVKNIRIQGERGEIRSIDTVQADGDSSVMTISKLAE